MSRLKIPSRRTADRTLAAPGRLRWPKRLVRIGLLAAAALPVGCSVPPPDIPAPRPIVIHSGERIRVEHDRMRSVNEWVQREERNIEEDPSFWVINVPTVDEVFPWQELYLSEGNDTVRVQTPLGVGDGSLVYQIYGHLHLMARKGLQAEWLPEAPDATGFQLERAILERCADAWVLGRTVFDTQPFQPLDELAYANEAGYLDAFIFTARPDEFAGSRAEWARANPGRGDEYREWFVETFNREPPGLRSN